MKTRFLLLLLILTSCRTLTEANKAYEAGNYQKAISIYKTLAKRGDSAAQYNLALYYDKNHSYKEAAKWYRMAAEQGHVEAQFNLGNCYYNGEGVEQSYTEAAKWYRKAAEQGQIETESCRDRLCLYG